MVAGKVAENSAVCSDLGNFKKIDSTFGPNPMSSIRSASSKMTVRRLLQSKAPRFRWSKRRPGVQTAICAPPSNAFVWCFAIWPPVSSTTRQSLVSATELAKLTGYLGCEFPGRAEDEGL